MWAKIAAGLEWGIGCCEFKHILLQDKISLDNNPVPHLTFHVKLPSLIILVKDGRGHLHYAKRQSQHTSKDASHVTTVKGNNII